MNLFLDTGCLYFFKIGSGEIEVGAVSGRTGIAGGDIQAAAQRALLQLPSQGVLTAAGTEE